MVKPLRYGLIFGFYRMRALGKGFLGIVKFTHAYVLLAKILQLCEQHCQDQEGQLPGPNRI